MKHLNSLSIHLIFLAFIHHRCSNAQTESILLDTATIIAQRQGFNVADFVSIVKSDTSFYQSFKNLHRFAYQINGNLMVFDKHGKTVAQLNRNAHQTTGSTHRIMVIDKDEITGSMLKKNGTYNYYTAQLFNDIFFDTKPVLLKSNQANDKSNKHIAQLKTLLFKPGTSVDGVPLVGNKLQLFDAQEKYYNYYLSTARYNDSLICYVFSCIAKTDEQGISSGNAVIKNLTTYFDKKTFQVVARKYVMQYASALFDFNVTMDIKIEPINGVFVPTHIAYNGVWDVAFKKAEIAQFQLQFYNWFIN